MARGNTTTDHDFIRRWIEERGGTPTRVKGTEGRDGEGILRIDFAEPDEKLEPISWDEFFETFEDRELAFLYQEKTADGHESRFFKFVHRSEGDGEGREDGGKPAHRPAVSRSAGSDRPAAAAKSAPEGKRTTANNQHRGSVKDPENDGRLKENREAGRAKASSGAADRSAEADDLKSREYRDEKGEVHHHTRAYMEQHRGERDKT